MSTAVDPDTSEHDVVTADDAQHAAAPETRSCPNCGAPAERGQLMCLECGSRLSLGYRRPATWRLAAVLGAIVLLIAGLGVAFALTADHSNGTTTAAAAPAQTTPAAPGAPADSAPTASQPTPAPTASTPTPAPVAGGTTATTPSTTPATPAPTPTPTTTPSGWPPGKSAFTVILASVPSRSEADAKLKSAQAAGISGAAILHSDDFPTLNRGYWVVFDGQYETIAQAQAQGATDRSKGGFTDAYPRFVSKDANAKP
jgi:cell division septation protein DedD